MSPEMNRRTFIKGSLAASAGGALPLAAAGEAAEKPKAPKAAMPKGTIGKLQVSRLLLGGNLLTHYTHSRDLKYVYSLAAHYNTEAKIRQTLAVAEQNGIDTLVVHTVPRVLKILEDHRKGGGKIQWIICPTAGADERMKAYSNQVQELADMGCEAIYVWGVRGDALTAAGKVHLIAKAVEIAKAHALPSGVGAHDLRVIRACEKEKVPADFYIKTLHHHNYPSGPKADEVKGPTREIPGYWCDDPKAVIEVMKSVAKPWIAFKVMAAGAIPPGNAFPYAFAGGADHVLAGMFDFEIAEDAAIVRKVLPGLKRSRPWRS